MALKKSAATAGLLLQSIIATHVDKNEFVAMASLDLSAAFDMVNTTLLLKRLAIIGLPTDVVELIKVWLVDRSFYVFVDGKTLGCWTLFVGPYKDLYWDPYFTLCMSHLFLTSII
jgi:hypothetical protein